MFPGYMCVYVLVTYSWRGKYNQNFNILTPTQHDRVAPKQICHPQNFKFFKSSTIGASLHCVLLQISAARCPTECLQYAQGEAQWQPD
jgi:hypothetical protein